MCGCLSDLTIYYYVCVVMSTKKYKKITLLKFLLKQSHETEYLCGYQVRHEVFFLLSLPFTGVHSVHFFEVLLFDADSF